MTVEELKRALEPWLKDRFQANVKIYDVIPLTGGACQENSLLELDVQDGPRKGSHRLVLRSDRGSSLLASLNREQEFVVSRAAFDAGCKTPEPFFYEMDEAILGKSFSLMEWIPGKATGRYIVKDNSLKDVRKTLPEKLAENLARIHSVQPGAKELDFLRSPEKDPAIEAVHEMRSEIKSLAEAHPAMELAVNWLEKNARPTDQLVLVHGDFRTGNFMVGPDGLHGILDWEFAHFGDRHEDISWLCMRDWRFGKLNLEAGGIAPREDFYAAYEKASGIPVDPFLVVYWEVMGNLRWAVGAAEQAERHLSGKTKGIELASIGRRVGEMEFEMLRLIEQCNK
ncbi:MAG: phosphotransferase family protein [Leptospiraceae bacterium]|nr:phosphotransferase family protein [Leptospiraceae bacterium]MCB1305548.1 phosphotransferase family protein [Leptospiraceae bacterium]